VPLERLVEQVDWEASSLCLRGKAMQEVDGDPAFLREVSQILVEMLMGELGEL